MTSVRLSMMSVGRRRIYRLVDDAEVPRVGDEVWVAGRYAKVIAVRWAPELESAEVELELKAADQPDLANIWMNAAFEGWFDPTLGPESGSSQ